MTDEQRDALSFMLSVIGLSGDPRVTKAHKVLRAMVAAPTRTQGADEPRCQYCDGTGDVHSIDGEWRGECTECKRADDAQPVAIEHAQLMKFYAVETTAALISAMERHIEKLQSKLPQYRDPVSQRVREG